MSQNQFTPYLICILLIIGKTQGSNPLNGKNLRIVLLEYSSVLTSVRNASNHVISIDGPLKHHLQALSQMLNFTYYCLPFFTPTFEPTSSKTAGLYYLTNNEADLGLGALIATPSRFANADYPAYWNEGGLQCIIPYPRVNINIEASIKPLSYEVWISVIVAASVTIIYLSFSIKNKIEGNTNDASDWKDKTSQMVQFVLRNLVNQGEMYPSTRLAFRIASGAWCVGCFFLIQIYCSTLTSHLTSPNQKPIANSVQQLAENPNLGFTTRKTYATDIFTQTATVGVLKKLGDGIKKDPNSRCNQEAECLEIVRKGYAGYGTSTNILKMLMADDLKKTGICRYYLLPDEYLRLPCYTPLQKRSPYTEMISVGTLRISQAGFHKQWEKWYVTTPWECMKLINRQDKIPRLSIAHLSGAFLILLAGYVLSLIAFIYEKIKSVIMCNKK